MGFAPNDVRLWPSGLVPYVLDDTYSFDAKKTVRNAIQIWNDETVLQFVEASGESDFLFIKRDYNNPTTCSTDVGVQGGSQWVSCSVDEPGLGLRAILHEIGHAVGLLHEHQRPDSHEHIRVHFDNIDRQYHHAYRQAHTGRTLTGYDYSSVMHYFGTSRLALDARRPVITRLDGSEKLGGETISPNDSYAIRQLYRPERTNVAYLVDRLFEWAPKRGNALSINVAVVRDKYNPGPIRKPLGRGADLIEDWSACGQGMMDMNGDRLRTTVRVVFSDRFNTDRHTTGEYETWRIELDTDGFMFQTVIGVDGDPNRADQITRTSVSPVIDLNTERGTDDEYLLGKFEIGNGSMLVVLSVDRFQAETI